MQYVVFSFHRSNFNFNSSHDFFSMELQVMIFCQGFSKDWKSRKALQVFGYWVYSNRQAGTTSTKTKKSKCSKFTVFSLLSNMWSQACLSLFLTFILTIAQKISRMKIRNCSTNVINPLQKLMCHSLCERR